MARILWINPVGTDAYDAPIGAELRAEAAVEHDRADAIILGCTIEFGFYREVQRKIGVPVIDAITAPLRYAEFLVILVAVAADNWTRSRRSA